jgi:hypothetical protein
LEQDRKNQAIINSKARIATNDQLQIEDNAKWI